MITSDHARTRRILIWDSKQTGLHVLVSRGPKDKRQATVTFRVVYYLKSQPGSRDGVASIRRSRAA